MKKLLLISGLICVFTKVNAQINLVKNPSFEKYSICPSGYEQLSKAVFWQPIDTVEDTAFIFICSPPYCNSCAGTNSLIGIPLNGHFYHYPRTGNGLVEFTAYFDNSYTEYEQRDYIQGHFYNTLVAGKTYCVTFYVILAQLSQYAISHIGAFLDDGTIDFGQDTASCHAPKTAFVPQIVADSIINDTLNWVKVQGVYTATGNEKFITIGNFFDIHHTDTIKRYINWPWGEIGASNNFSWYLLDDVSVIAIDDTANAGPDRITSATGDSVWVGDTTGYLPCYWYASRAGSSVWSLIDSNTAGFKVHPDTTTRYVMVLDVCGHVSSDTAVVRVAPTIIASPRPSPKEREVSVWPNPAKSTIVISSPEIINQITISNMVGQCVYEQLDHPLPLLKTGGECQEEVDVSFLQKGVYFVKINGVEVRRFVKE